jgi:transposase
MKFGRIGGFPNQREFDSTSVLGRRPAWMAKPLSTDLRERAISGVEAGGSVRAVAASLSISPSCVVKWSLKVDYRSVWAFVHEEKLSLKKNRASQRARAF